ncbi:MAG TPA: ABC transporter ATP-binding protein [Vicinamibacteria bacterium]|nr:ABC transporter ATP-binding protein [Vicinamibacteria bacterium]
MASPAAVRFEQVKKRFGAVEVVRGIDLDVAPGECLVLLGPSGCGKTTLLRLLAGLETPDSGRILIGDRSVEGIPPAQRDVAMVFQNYALYPHFTAFQNVAFPLSSRGVAASDIDPRVRDAARRLSIEGLLDRRPAELSGGQQQRVALARALVRNPAVFLMDEPLSNLDAQLRVQTRTELKRLQQELGTTTLYVTHDQGEAMTLGGRVALLRGGIIEQVGPPLELYRRPATRFVAGFLGSPGINFVPVVRTNGALDVAGVRLPAPPDVPAGAVLEAGVRPEDVELAGEAAPGFAPARALTSEPMGNETIVTLAAGDLRLVARAGPEWEAAPGTPLHFRLVPERVHLFDTASGLCISNRHSPS